MFFKIGANGLLELEKEEIRNISVFKAILEADKGSDGDHDGRKKHYAFKEFYYIWWNCYVGSPGILSGYNDKELHLQGIREARLEPTYRPNKLVKDAMAYFKAEQAERLISSTALINLIRGIRLSNEVTKRLIVSMETILEEDRKEEALREVAVSEGKIPEPINLVEAAQRTTALLSLLDQLAVLSKKVPIMLAELESLEKKLKVEESGSATVRGGGIKKLRMDPK